MSAGLYPLGVIAKFLGQRPEQMKERIAADGLPAIKVPAETKPMRKVPLLGLHGWLAERSEGRPLTPDELERELDRCAEELRREQRAKAAKRRAAA